MKIKRTKIIVISLSLIIGIFFFDFGFHLFSKEPTKYHFTTFGGDGYTYFGDGRFQILTGETKSLFDEAPNFQEENGSECLIGDIERYIENNKYAYITGYYTCGWSINIARQVLYSIPYSYENYQSRDVIPRHTILNYTNGDIRLYKTLDEIPESDRKIFEKDLNFWCKFKRTCYEK